MRLFFHKTLFLLGKDKKKLPIIMFFFVCLSSIELLGISLLLPFISVISDPLSLFKYKTYFDNFSFIPSSRNEFILFLSYTIILLFISKMIFSIWINNIIIKFSFNHQIKLSSKLLRAYQEMDFLNFINKNSSEYVRDISLLTEQYSTIILAGALKATSEILIAIFMLSFLLYVNTLGFIVLVIFISIIIVAYDTTIKKKVKSYSIKSNHAHKNLIKNLNEAMSGFKESRIYNYEDFFHNRTIDSVREYVDHRKKYKFLQSIPKYLIETTIVVFVAILIIFAIKTIDDISNILTTIAIFGIVSVRLVPTSNILSSTIIQLRFANDAVSIMYQILNDNNIAKKNIKTISYDKSPIFRSLSFKNASFSYLKGKKQILKNINLKLNKGEMIAIIGESGSGKTTMIDLMLGFIEPDKGNLIFNDRDTKDIKENWKSCFAYLPQRPLLLDRSIKENITLGHQTIDEIKLLKAVEKSNLKDFVKNLPNKLETVIGENGNKISGGQRQRIALARAIFNDKQILILDEPTSALDKSNEEDIIKELKKLSRNTAIVLVTHSTDYLKYFDSVYNISNGKIH